MNILMIDVETLGVSGVVPIIQIGAVAFSDSSQSSVKFQVSIDLESQKAPINPDTLLWHLENNKENFTDIITGRAPIIGVTTAQNKFSLSEAFQLFTDFVWTVSGEKILIHNWEVWAKGQFDLPVLRAAAESVGCQLPWPFRIERDLRTLQAIVSQLVPAGDKIKWEKGIHSALDDCLAQKLNYNKAMYELKHYIKASTEI